MNDNTIKAIVEACSFSNEKISKLLDQLGANNIKGLEILLGTEPQISFPEGGEIEMWSNTYTKIHNIEYNHLTTEVSFSGTKRYSYQFDHPFEDGSEELERLQAEAETLNMKALKELQKSFTGNNKTNFFSTDTSTEKLSMDLKRFNQNYKQK